MRIHRGPIDGKVIKEMSEGHEYGDGWITFITSYQFEKAIDRHGLYDFEEEISRQISPNDQNFLAMEYKIVGFEDNNVLLMEITADATHIISAYDTYVEENKKWYE